MSLNKLDLFFSYKFVYRFLLINQWGLFVNTYQLPIFQKLIIFFRIYSLTDLDDVRSFNYVYLIRFFFGKKAFFRKYFTKFHLGVTYFSFIVNCFFFKEHSFFPLGVFINDFLFFSSDQYFFSSLFYSGKFFSFWFTDMNIFIEKKTNVGFHNLKDPLGFSLFFSNYFFFYSFLLVNMFKIKIKKHNFGLYSFL